MAYGQNSEKWKRITKKNIVQASDSVELSKKVVSFLEVGFSVLISARHQTRYHKRKLVCGLNDFDLSSLDELHTVHNLLILSHES
jgi:phage gp37-like protein